MSAISYTQNVFQNLNKWMFMFKHHLVKHNDGIESLLKAMCIICIQYPSRELL